MTIQDQILTLLGSLRAELDLALLLVTHDLAAVARTCDRVAVIYAARIVKTGPVASVFAAPRHHYTDGLLRAAPRLDRPGVLPRGIGGTPPAHAALARCASPRCPKADDMLPCRHARAVRRRRRRAPRGPPPRSGRAAGG